MIFHIRLGDLLLSFYHKWTHFIFLLSDFEQRHTLTYSQKLSHSFFVLQDVLANYEAKSTVFWPKRI